MGEIDPDPAIKPNYATNRTETGRFRRAVARNLGITPEQRPWLFVVKKNKSVLDQLLAWITHHVANTQDPETGRGIVTNLPLLLIDDEADHASVDTGEQVFDEDGRPDEEHQPTAINRLVRRILKAFARRPMSATPRRRSPTSSSTNVAPRARKARTSSPLPSSSIWRRRPAMSVRPACSATGSDGWPRECRRCRSSADEGPVTSRMTEPGWMPPNHKKDHRPDYQAKTDLPPSLNEAIDAFLLACAAPASARPGARAFLDAGSCHPLHMRCSSAVHEQVEEHIRHMKQRLLRRIEHEGRS